MAATTNHRAKGRFIRGVALGLAISVSPLAMAPALAQGRSAPMALNIPAQSAPDAITQLARQTGTQILFDNDRLRRVRTRAVNDVLTAQQALRVMLQGSGFEVGETPSGALVIRRRGESASSGEVQAVGAPADTESADAGPTPEILVVGNRSQNVDIRRTEDDAQPYVVFDAREIEESNATNLEDFFRRRLPMNTQVSLTDQGGNNVRQNINVSAITLRGLGANQTLILVDGRRLPRLTPGGGVGFNQADINGIPLSAIERIEVLPSTAGAIYGGGAVGGVINIIRRRDYNGLTIRAGVEGSFRGGGETFRADLTGGISLNGGGTQISFSASHSASRPLLGGSNDLILRARERFVARGGIVNFSGSTPNIRTTNGANLVLDAQYGGTTLSSDHLFVPAGYQGLGASGIAPLIANIGRYNLDLPADATGRDFPFSNGPRVRSANINARQRITSSIDAFADFTVTDNLARGEYFAFNANTVTLQANAPNNPFNQAIIVYFPNPDGSREARTRSQTLAAGGGLIFRLGGDWSATAEYNWSRARQTGSSVNTAFRPTFNAALTSGALDIIRDVNQYPIDYSPYSLESADGVIGPVDTVQQLLSMRAAGSLLELPAGKLGVTALLEHRAERARTNRARFYTDGALTSINVNFPRIQEVDSAYLEARVPIFSERNAIPFIRELDVQLSTRHDRYRTRVAVPLVQTVATENATLLDPSYERNRFRSTDYTAAIRWSPLSGVTMRGSYATGFLPPNIGQLVSAVTPGSTFSNLRDPRRNNELVGTAAPFQVLGGGNSALGPEASRSWSAGVIVAPVFIPGFRLSVDYTRLIKRDEISGPGSQFFINSEADFPDRIRRATTTDGSVGPIIFIDNTLINISRVRIRAYDFQADYRFETSNLGRFRFYAVATLQTQLERTNLPTSVPNESVDFSNGPRKWRGNGGVEWAIGNWAVGWNAQYYHSFDNRNTLLALDAAANVNIVNIEGRVRTPSQMFHDVNVRYRFGPGSSIFADMEISLGIQNIFDTRPRILSNSLATGGYARPADPALRSYSLFVRRSF